MVTHLSETLRKHADELLTREDVQLLVDRLRKTQPSLVGEVVGEVAPIGLLQRVLKNLLSNQIPIRELTNSTKARPARFRPLPWSLPSSIR
jgi:flagellar biosynthesis protein FlhA